MDKAGIPSALSPAGAPDAPGVSFWMDGKLRWLIVAAAAGLTVWFMPGMPGLARVGQQALAVVLFTVLLWISGAVPPAVGSMLMMAIVLCFMPDMKAAVFLSFWTQDTMWFILLCFIFSSMLEVSGLGRRLALYVFSLRSLIRVDLALLGMNALFSAVGMNASFPKLSLLLPLVTSMALLSGMEKDDPYVRHLAIMITVLANTTGTLVYSGFSMNPALGPLGGFEVNYTSWLHWFFVPSLVYASASFIVIYVLFLPPKGKSFDPEIAGKQRRELGPVTFQEKKAMTWLSLAVLLWVTGGFTGIKTGFAALLVGTCVLLPRIGMLTFKDFIQKTDWNAVFMLMGVLAIGTLSVTGFAGWIWGHILPERLSDNPLISISAISALVQLMHIPLGSTATTQALAIPSLADYASAIGVSRICISFVAHLSIIGQYFFVYQNAALVVGLGYGLWRPRDIVKYGLGMFVVTPLTLGVLLYPWWAYMGWIQ